MRIFSQSSSVFGAVSIVPSLVVTALTASKMLSDAGSSMSRISSLTDTTALSSPHSAGGRSKGGDGFDDEHADIRAPRTTGLAHVARCLRVRTPNTMPMPHLNSVLIADSCQVPRQDQRFGAEPDVVLSV